MSYLVTWSNGEEVEYLFLTNGVDVEQFLEADKNYIITYLNGDNAWQ